MVWYRGTRHPVEPAAVSAAAAVWRPSRPAGACTGPSQLACLPPLCCVQEQHAPWEYVSQLEAGGGDPTLTMADLMASRQDTLLRTLQTQVRIPAASQPCTAAGSTGRPRRCTIRVQSQSNRVVDQGPRVPAHQSGTLLAACLAHSERTSPPPAAPAPRRACPSWASSPPPPTSCTPPLAGTPSSPWAAPAGGWTTRRCGGAACRSWRRGTSPQVRRTSGAAACRLGDQPTGG